MAETVRFTRRSNHSPELVNSIANRIRGLDWGPEPGSIRETGRKFEANSGPDKMKITVVARRDGRVAEGARLESVYTFTGIGGSNPSLSAIFLTDGNSGP
jgi:hypothetical protein